MAMAPDIFNRRESTETFSPPSTCVRHYISKTEPVEQPARKGRSRDPDSLISRLSALPVNGYLSECERVPDTTTLSYWERYGAEMRNRMRSRMAKSIGMAADHIGPGAQFKSEVGNCMMVGGALYMVMVITRTS